MTGWNDAVTRDWCEAHESQQPDGQKLHEVTLRGTHSGIFMGDKTMSEQPMAYEEVPGGRTLQQAVEQPQRERWAYEELQAGDAIQAGDQWQNSDGRWQAIVLIPGASAQVRDGIRARRPHNITALQKERDNAENALKSAQRARDELQLQVDELRTGLMGVVSAEHVHSMLEDMLDQTEWVGQCLDSTTYEQMSCIQRTISMIAQRVNDMGKEATSADA